jgi:hypothetical protein
MSQAVSFQPMTADIQIQFQENACEIHGVTEMVFCLSTSLRHCHLTNILDQLFICHQCYIILAIDNWDIDMGILWYLSLCGGS